MKFLVYAVAWFIVLSQCNDLRGYYYYTPNTPMPMASVIITVLATIILSIATYKELTKGKK